MSTLSTSTSLSPITTAHRSGAALGKCTDQALIKRIARQDITALEELMQRHQVRVLRFVLRMVRDRCLADDLVCDTFFDIWRQAHRFENRCMVGTWIMAIARNKALSARKRLNGPTETLDETVAETAVDSSAGPDSAVECRDTARVLQQCVKALPAEQALLIELVYFREKSLKEAAVIAGVPENTVKTRMFLARKKLAVLLAGAGVDNTSISLNWCMA